MLEASVLLAEFDATDPVSTSGNASDGTRARPETVIGEIDSESATIHDLNCPAKMPDGIPTRSISHAARHDCLWIAQAQINAGVGPLAAEIIPEAVCPEPDAGPALSAAQGLHDDYLIIRLRRLRQRIRRHAIDEDTNVAAHSLLLVNDAKANAGILPVQIDQHVIQRRAQGIGLTALGIRTQGARDQHVHDTARL